MDAINQEAQSNQSKVKCDCLELMNRNARVDFSRKDNAYGQLQQRIS
jgi:hypothetical protein